MDDGTARAAVLRSANTIFYERGIAGVGMADIRDDSGVSLRRLYALYPSKRGLVAAWLIDRHTIWMEWFASSVERRRSAGEEPLLAAFGAIAEWAESPGYRGCAFVNSAAETAEIDDSHRRIIAAHKGDLLTYLTSLAGDGGYSEPRATWPHGRRSPRRSHGRGCRALFARADRRGARRCGAAHRGVAMSHFVEQLWRYPVKTLAGERLASAELTAERDPRRRIVHVRGPEGVRTSRRQHRLLGSPRHARSGRASVRRRPCRGTRPRRSHWCGSAQATMPSSTSFDGLAGSTFSRSSSRRTVPWPSSGATSGGCGRTS